MPLNPGTRFNQYQVAAPGESAGNLFKGNCGALTRRRYSRIKELILLECPCHYESARNTLLLEKSALAAVAPYRLRSGSG